LKGEILSLKGEKKRVFLLRGFQREKCALREKRGAQFFFSESLGGERSNGIERASPISTPS